MFRLLIVVKCSALSQLCIPQPGLPSSRFCKHYIHCWISYYVYLEVLKGVIWDTLRSKGHDREVVRHWCNALRLRVLNLEYGQHILHASY